MSAAVSSAGITIHGAPDTDIGTKDARANALQVMQLDMTQDVVDELLECVRSGKSPQILFGRTPQLKYGDKSHVLQSNSESCRYELYQSGDAGDDHDLTFAGIIGHSLAVQKAEQVTSGVDTALENLKNSMAAISEMKEANKTIVGNASPVPTPGHRRFPSKSFKHQQHLLPASNLSSPLRSAPSSPALTQGAMSTPPTSQPTDAKSAELKALRIPIIHLLAVEPQTQNWLALKTRAKTLNLRDLLVRVAKENSGKWQLLDRAFKELDPHAFPYKADQDREKAIDNAIRAFDRQRLPKEDKLWQVLLPKGERGKGKVLSRLNVQAPAQKASTPMHKITKTVEKKAAPKTEERKAEDKQADKEGNKAKEPKAKKSVKDRDDANKAVNAAKSATAKSNATSTEASKIRKKAPAAGDSSTPRQKSKVVSRDAPPKERTTTRPTKPSMPANTKPKNPSPLSASPPVNASDFEDSHPVHKALSGAPSPAKTSSGNSDRSLKRKANDTDSSIHDHNLSVKQRKVTGSTSSGSTPHSASSKANGSTPSSANSLKRKAEDSDRQRRHDSHTPSAGNAVKHRKVASIDTHIANRYPVHNNNNNNALSPGSSSSATSPTLPGLSFRQTVELSQNFQKYYKSYEELYWQLAESERPPSEQQREQLMKMHRKLEEMKRDIKAGALAKSS